MMRLEVFDVAGRLVAMLDDGRRPAGEHRSAWNLLDTKGRPAANGTYFFRLKAGGESSLARVLLVR
jgi:hypothetical protein